MASKANRLLELFDQETSQEVRKWAKSVPSYDDITKVSKAYWEKAREITNKKYHPSDEMYWPTFFQVMDDITKEAKHV